jgi:hypothetical protein
MALDYFRARLGISMDDEVELLHGDFDPSSTGQAAPEGSLFQRQSTGNAALYLKTGATDTDWTILSADDENGYQNTYMGKPSAGAVTPLYTDENYITDGDSLTTAVDKLDQQIGTPITTGNYIAAGTTNENLIALDDQVKVNADAIQALTTSPMQILHWLSCPM